MRRTFIEYYSFRPAGNKKAYKAGLPFHILTPRIGVFSTGEILAILPDIVEKLRWKDPYKLRIVYERTKEGVRKRKYSSYFYVAGRVVDKAEVLEYFHFSPETQKKISTFEGDKVFWVHYQVEPLSDKNNYECLPFFEPELASAKA